MSLDAFANSMDSAFSTPLNLYKRTPTNNRSVYHRVNHHTTPHSHRRGGDGDMADKIILVCLIFFYGTLPVTFYDGTNSAPTKATIMLVILGVCAVSLIYLLYLKYNEHTKIPTILVIILFGFLSILWSCNMSQLSKDPPKSLLTILLVLLVVLYFGCSYYLYTSGENNGESHYHLPIISFVCMMVCVCVGIIASIIYKKTLWISIAFGFVSVGLVLFLIYFNRGKIIY